MTRVEAEAQRRLHRAEQRLREVQRRPHRQGLEHAVAEVEAARKQVDVATARAYADARIRCEKSELEAKLEAERKSWK
jgi:hypothetical protein